MKRIYVNWKRCCFFTSCVLGMTALVMNSSQCLGQSLPSSTAIPVQFTRTIQAGKDVPGTKITAKTMQAVIVGGDMVLPKGAKIEGRVTSSHAFVFNPAPYAVQQPSDLSIHFNEAIVGSKQIPLNVSVRALADNLDANDASYPHRLGDSDSSLGTIELIGGDQYSPVGKTLLNSDSDVAGYVRKQGVFGRLMANTYTSRSASFGCSGTLTEQSLAIFSPSACGLYGLDSVSMPDNGRKDGTFRLESRHHTLKLYAGSAALLEVNGPQP